MTEIKLIKSLKKIIELTGAIVEQGIVDVAAPMTCCTKWQFSFIA